MPLYSTLSSRQQQDAISPEDVHSRRCIISTNIAETSLTIDGIVYVIDAGLANEMSYNPRARLNMLQAREISKAAADQRKGRAGRTQAGQCFRLYSKDAFNKLPESVRPGISTADMQATILMLKKSGYGDLTKLDWIEPPAPEVLLRGLEGLYDM
jgi:pre-mRNA-splicing factor ATP-dependent RNA helicase DHX15/PRP43